jgi:hypothetical protein
MNMPTLMVQMDDHKWTLNALHEACGKARTRGAQVVLALMLPQRHVVFGNINVDRYQFTDAEAEELREYNAVAAEYGVPLMTRVFEYDDLEEGISAAADALNAETVYARLPGALLPVTQHSHERHLEEVLEAHHHDLRLLDTPIISHN